MRNALAIFTLAACLSLTFPASAQTSTDVDALTKKEQAAREKAKVLEAERQKVRKEVSALKKTLSKTAGQIQSIESVSYTHLTLPTIYPV